MQHIIIECTFDDECPYANQTYSPLVAMSDLDSHLQDEHDTDLETEFARLESETGQSVESLIDEQLRDQIGK